MLAAAVLPKWVTDEHAITLATWWLVVVTFLLVIATFFLWLDSWKKGNKQRERWKLEDEQHKLDREEELARWRRNDDLRNEERKPKYRFGLELKDRGATPIVGTHRPRRQASLWVANLGSLGICVDRLFVEHRERGVAEFNINRVVPVGDQLILDIPNEFWERVPGISGTSDGNYVFGDHEVWLSVADPYVQFDTAKVLYYIVYLQKDFVELRIGANEYRQPVVCPNCECLLNLCLPASGLISEREVQESLWQPMLKELRASCPNHSSSHLRQPGNNPPAWLQPYV